MDLAKWVNAITSIIVLSVIIFLLINSAALSARNIVWPLMVELVFNGIPKSLKYFDLSVWNL